MDLKVQEDLFNKVYSEYKTYKKYYDEKIPEVKKEREEFAKFAEANKDNMELLTEKYYDISETFVRHDKDVFVLQTKLLNFYDAYGELLDIPKDIVEEISSFERPFLYYNVNSSGSIEEVVTPELTELKKQQKKAYKETIKNFLSRMNV